MNCRTVFILIFLSYKNLPFQFEIDSERIQLIALNVVYIYVRFDFVLSYGTGICVKKITDVDRSRITTQFKYTTTVFIVYE